MIGMLSPCMAWQHVLLNELTLASEVDSFHGLTTWWII